jgi:tRNA nucleotidyltransferase (CCA-adding enzyme)
VVARRVARRNPGRISLSLIPPDIREAAAYLRSTRRGVKTNLVGGAVIDLLSGRQPKDWDIEVFGLSWRQLAEAAGRIGKANEVGKSFGIVAVSLPSGKAIDLSLPRRENKIGIGHKGFEAEFDPQMTYREAARRRDFTINSLAMDLDTGRIIDPFGGLRDLEAGVLKATDPKKFVEDPLRALRAAQLLARKARTVHPSTVALIRSIKGSHGELAAERIFEEWRKLLLKAPKPSMGLDLLEETEWLEHYPELHQLRGTPQNPEWHPEGDAWEHTKLVTDAAAEIREHVPEHQRGPYMFGALLHDVGKPSTTDRETLTSHGHDEAGRPLARRFMERIKAPRREVDLIEEIVGLHMRGTGLTRGKGGRKAYARLLRRLNKVGGDLDLLARMSMADSAGSRRAGERTFTRSGEPEWGHGISQAMRDWQKEFEEKKELLEPAVRGRDLIEMGYRPGPKFSGMLRRALELQDGGRSKEEIMDQVKQEFPPVQKNPRSDEVILYHMGRRAPKPRPYKADPEGGWERPHFKEPVQSGVWLSPSPYRVETEQGFKLWSVSRRYWRKKGKHPLREHVWNTYAYAIHKSVLKAAGGIHIFDGAPEVLIPEALWREGKQKRLIRFLGKSRPRG